MDQFKGEGQISQIQIIQSQPCNETEKHSDHLSEYNILLQINPLKKLSIPHNKQLLNKKYFGSFKSEIEVKVLHHSLNYQMLTLDVNYGQFNKKINIININKTSPTYNLNCIGTGKYGSIFQYVWKQENVAIKCIQFNDNNFKVRLKQAIQEYMMLLIAADFEIGPPIIKIYGFDMAVYYKSIQFSMEKCKMKYKFTSQKAKQIKRKLRCLHQLNIVHIDIKPQNIGFSPTLKSMVFLDYGFSRLLSQSIGKKSFTYFKGSYEYCSDDMMKLFGKLNGGQIDLYHNDAIGLSKSLIVIENKNKGQQFEQAYLQFVMYEFETEFHIVQYMRHLQLLHIKFVLFLIAFEMQTYQPSIWKQNQQIIRIYKRQIKQTILYLPFGQYYSDILFIMASKKWQIHNVQLQQRLNMNHLYQSLSSNQNFIYRYNILSNLHLRIQDDFFLQNILTFDKELLLNKDVIINIPRTEYYLKVIRFIKINGFAANFQQIHAVCKFLNQVCQKGQIEDSLVLYKICVLEIMFFGFQHLQDVIGHNILKQLVQTLIILQILSQSQLQELYYKILSKIQPLITKLVLVFQIIISLQFTRQKFISSYNYQKMRLFCIQSLRNYLNSKEYEQIDKKLTILIKIIVENKTNMPVLYQKTYLQIFDGLDLPAYQRQFLTKRLCLYILYLNRQIILQNTRKIPPNKSIFINQQYLTQISNNKHFQHYQFYNYDFYYSLSIYQKCRNIYKSFNRTIGLFAQSKNFNINIWHILSKVRSNNNENIQSSMKQSSGQYQQIYQSYKQIIQRGSNIHKYILILIQSSFITSCIKYQQLVKAILIDNKFKLFQLKLQQNLQHRGLHINPLKAPIQSIINIIVFLKHFCVFDDQQIDEIFQNLKQSFESIIEKIDCFQCKISSLICFRMQLINYYWINGQMNKYKDLLIQMIIFCSKVNQFNDCLPQYMQYLMLIAQNYINLVNQLAIVQLTYDFIVASQGYFILISKTTNLYNLLHIYKLIKLKYDTNLWIQLIQKIAHQLTLWKSATFDTNFYHSTQIIVSDDLSQISVNSYGYHQVAIQYLLKSDDSTFNACTSLYFLPFLELKINNQLNLKMIVYIAKSIDLLGISTKVFILSKYYQAYLQLFQINKRKKQFLLRRKIRLNEFDKKQDNLVKKWRRKSQLRQNNKKYFHILGKLEKVLKNKK